MKLVLPILFVITVATLGVTGCSKTEKVEPAQTVQKSPMERIAEIDSLLALPPSGTTENANQRAVLRAERNALSGGASQTLQSQQTMQQRQAQQQLQQQNFQATQAQRDHQRMIDQMKADAERSRVAEQRQLQAQRDQWAKEDRAVMRQQSGNYRAEAPASNTYDVQIDRTRSDGSSGSSRRPHP